VVVDYPRGDAPPSEVFHLADNGAVEYLRRTLQPLFVADRQDPLLGVFHEDLESRGVDSLLLVPLIVGGQVIGSLNLEIKGEERQFSPGQIEIAQTIASQAAIAAQNANLLEQSFLRTRELETLFEASQATALTLDLNEVIQSVAQQMLHALAVDACTIMLWDEVEQMLVVYADLSMTGDDSHTLPVGTLIALSDFPDRAQALNTREPLMVRSGEGDPDSAEQVEMAAAGSASRMFVPLVVRETSIGLIKAEFHDPYRSFGLSEQRIARTLAGQAAIAIENARLNSETAAQVQEAFLINDLSRAVSAAVDMRELLPIVRSQIPSLTRAQWLYLAIFDDQSQELNFPVAIREGDDITMADRPLGNDEFSWIVRNNRPLLLVGQELNQVRLNLDIDTVLPPDTSFLGVPLSIGIEAVGVLAVGDDLAARSFGVNDQRVLTTVAGQLAVAVQNASLFSEMRRFNMELEQRVQARTEEVRAERDRLNVLYNITSELSATLDMDRVLERALELLAKAIGGDQGMIMLIDHQQDRLYKRAELGGDVSTPGPEGGLRVTEGLAGWVIQNRQSVVVDDVQRDPRWLSVTEKHRVPRATLAVLLETSDEVLGVLLLYSTQVGVFNADHLRLVEAAANQLATSINNAELYLFIREQAERLGDMVREQQVEASKSNAILEGVADGVLFANQLGEIIVFNRASERILGMSRNDLLHRPISNLSGLYGGGGKRWADTIQLWMEDPSQLSAGDYLSEVLDVGEKVIQVTLAPVRMGDQFLGTVSVFRDITREVEVDRMKTEFISNVSHELRTPMTSIKGYADLLVMGAAGEVSERQQEFLGTIKSNADRLSNLVNDLLNISRIDSGRVEMNIQQTSLPRIARMVLTNLDGRIKNEGHKDLTVVDEIDPDLPETYADSDKLTQVLTNLLDNAYQYTPDGGKITMSVQMDDEKSFLISVADTGIGIPKKYQGRVFDRFFRNDDHTLVIETPGTGLGLALVKELVEMHNGHIWLESREGEGTTFFVQLPLVTTPPVVVEDETTVTEKEAQ
jgi:signal transduction histidine kinase